MRAFVAVKGHLKFAFLVSVWREALRQLGLALREGFLGAGLAGLGATGPAGQLGSSPTSLASALARRSINASGYCYEKKQNNNNNDNNIMGNYRMGVPICSS